jgi:hypothetical protein
MKKRLSFSLMVIAAVYLTLSSCSGDKTKFFSVAFYNVENLFDTVDDPHKHDNNYLPTSSNPWNTERYNHKLQNLARVMSAIDPNGFPTVFGLSEVENRKVVEDLINTGKLKKAGYKIIHKDSPDERGIDVAMLYQPEKYKPLKTRFIHLSFPTDPNNGTRDIIYSKGLVYGKDTIHIFINHWVSRYGGREKTDKFRRYTGHLLRLITDSIYNVQPNANILIEGDLNDNPTDTSVYISLGAKEVKKPFAAKQLYNLSYSLYKNGQGTVYYRGWNMFDQIIVSTALVAGYHGMKTVTDHQIIIKKDWMLYKPKKGEPRPNRTASGKHYYGGYSDHLPVFIEIEVDMTGEIFTII